MSTEHTHPIDDELSPSSDPYGEDDLVGATLSNTYQIVAVIGEGGTGRVYEAKHTRIPSKRFAIKLLHAEYARNPDAIKRFQREAEAASRLTGNNSVTVVDVDCLPDGRPFLVSEHLDGVDLGAHLDHVGVLSVKEAVAIARQVCRALAEAHSQGVIHRDVKPDNIFLTGDLNHPDAKVLDYGLSRLDKGGTLTRAGMIMGTPMYMSPEQARGERADHRTDIYGVGCILYRALAGTVPFERDDPNALMLAVMNDEPTRLRTLRKDVPESLEMAVQRAMAKEPYDRFDSAMELDAALAPHGAGDAKGPPPPDVVAPRHVRLRLVAWLLVAFLWVVVASVIAVASVSGMIQGEGPTITRTELLVALAVIFSATFTPMLLVIRHVRRNTWQSSPKVLGLLRRIRTTLVASFAAYGAAALIVTLANHILVSVSDWSLLRVGTAPWHGWTLVFLIVSVVAGTAAAIVRSRSRLATLGGGLPVTLLALCACGGVMYGGFMWRASATPEGDTPIVPDVVEPATSVEAQPSSSAIDTLAKEAPAEPAALKALALEQGSDEATHIDAIASVRALLEQAPEQATDKDVRSMLIRLAIASKAARDSSLELMAKRMGEHGPDMLYDIMVSTPKMRDTVKTILGKEEVRARATPALRIAYDLKVADKCEQVNKLLDRAAADGDGRAVILLSYYSDGTKRGCGWKKKQPCRAKCPMSRKPIRAISKAIRTRLGGG